MNSNTPSNKEKIVNSKSIRAYSYDAQTYKLSVTFADGAEYEYSNVMPDVMSQVFDSPRSIGSKFRRLIAYKYKYTKQ